jgi:hypothetical protein
MRISFGGGSSGNRSLYMLMGLSVVLIVVLWQVINKVPVLFSSGLTTSERRDKSGSVNRFDDAQKEVVKKRFAGYWVFETDTISGVNTIHKSDRVEYKDNGIIWQVITWDVAMPSGKRSTFHQVRTAYCNPFGTAGNGDTICETAVLKQAFLTRSDTCVDKSTKVVYLETWNARRNGGKLNLCNREYTLYAGDPAAFFPDGMIRFVDSIMHRICNGQTYISEFVRASIAAELEKTVSSGDRGKEITTLIDRYYVPAVIAENWRGFSKSALKKIGVSFQVTPQGTITAGDGSEAFFKGLLFEMETWRFPKPVGNAGKTPIDHVFDLSIGAPGSSSSKVR